MTSAATGEDGEGLAFEVYGQHGPGALDLRVFDQDQVWVDILGVPHALHEMDDTYRANVIGHLYEHADLYLRGVVRDEFTETAVAALTGERPPDRADRPADAVGWVEATPLMRRLRAMTPRWEGHVTDERDEITNAPTGRWRVITEGSTYLVDLDNRTVSRAPRQGTVGVTGDLRRDGNPIPLLELALCRRAEQAVMMLDIRGDGVATLRVTSLVARITRDTHG